MNASLIPHEMNGLSLPFQWKTTIIYYTIQKKVYLFIYLLNKFIFIKGKDLRLRSSSGNNVPFMRHGVGS